MWPHAKDEPHKVRSVRILSSSNQTETPWGANGETNINTDCSGGGTQEDPASRMRSQTDRQAGS